MAASSTAQVVFKGNTADLQKKLKVAEKGMQEFKDMGSDALSSIGDLFGVNTGKIGDMLGSVKKLSAGFQAMGSTGNSALSGLTRGMSMLSAGVAAVGIAGLVAGFKELNRQAELFAQTDVGAAFMNVQNTWRDTYSMATMEAGEGGSGWLKFKERFKTGAQRLGTIFGNTFANTLQGESFSNAFTNAITVDTQAVGKALSTVPFQQALTAAKQYQRDQSMVWAEQARQIREYERIAKDTSKTEEERNAAQQKAYQLTTQRGNDIARSYYNIYNAQKKLSEAAGNTQKDNEELAKSYTDWQNSLGEMESSLTSLEKLGNRINKSNEGGSSGASAAAADTDDLAEAIDGLYASIQSAIDVNRTFGGVLSDEDVTLQSYRSSLENIVATYGVEDERIKTLIADYKKLQQERVMAAPLASVSAPTATATITPVATKEGIAGQMQGLAGWKMPELTSEQKQYYEFLQGMVDATEKANEAISDALVNGISNSIQYLADCFMGLEEFNGAGLLSALLTPLANVAVEMGEILIAQGIGVEACKKALESLNGYAAIAAGVALVTIGAAAKAGLRSAVSRATGGGYSTSVASSAYTSNASNPSSFGREMEVKVTGTLTANGSQLVAVLNNEHNRNSYTT